MRYTGISSLFVGCQFQLSVISYQLLSVISQLSVVRTAYRSLFAGEVLRRKVSPRTLTARQHAHSVLIHAICIPNLANVIRNSGRRCFRPCLPKCIIHYLSVLSCPQVVANFDAGSTACGMPNGLSGSKSSGGSIVLTQTRLIQIAP